jgi:hypothetical protein
MVERFGFAPIAIERWHDTLAVCAYQRCRSNSTRPWPCWGRQSRRTMPVGG